MTREEAIGVLEDVRDAICENIPGSHPELDELKEAVQMAVNALEERKTGKWIHTDTQAGYDINGDLVWADMMKCETCGFEICAIQGHIAQYNYCPNCGADMRGEGHE